MTYTTFLRDSELNQKLPVAELQELLERVRSKTGQDWQVVPRLIKSGFWKKPVTVYGLYVYIGGVGPWQCINFYRDKSDTSINIDVSLELIAAYLFGVLSK